VNHTWSVSMRVELEVFTHLCGGGLTLLVK
jgi:hypothetical protein